MIYSSNFEQEIEKLRKTIQSHLNDAMTNIVKQEVEKIMGRVKVMVTKDLGGPMHWYIEPNNKD